MHCTRQSEVVLASAHKTLVWAVQLKYNRATNYAHACNLMLIKSLLISMFEELVRSWKLIKKHAKFAFGPNECL